MTATPTHRPFSQRHQSAIEEGTIEVTLGIRLRKRLWKVLAHYDFPISYQPDPYDNWTVNSTGLRELPNALQRIYGVDDLCEKLGVSRGKDDEELETFFFACNGHDVFDVIEVFFSAMYEQQANLQREINQALQDEGCHWLLCDGYFFKLDSKWIEQHVLTQAHELLGKGKFDGALDEFREARNYLLAEDYKAAIHNSTKAFESLLKAVQQREDGTAKKLVDALKASPFYTAFPESLAAGFGDNVLMALPFIRNRIGGHGQGQGVVAVPPSLAEFAVNLAGTLIVFVVKRHLEVSTEKKHVDQNEAEMDSTGDDIPF